MSVIIGLKRFSFETFFKRFGFVLVSKVWVEILSWNGYHVESTAQFAGLFLKCNSAFWARRIWLLGRPTGFTPKLSFLSFYQSTALSSQAVDGHQMYSGGSAVGKASTIGIEISPTPPLIYFHRGQKVRNFGVVFNITQLWAACVWKDTKISEFWNKFLV